VGVVIGLVLVAFGAILTWGVHASASGLNITAIGVILLVLGILVVLLDFFWWQSWAAIGPWRETTYVRRSVPRPRRRVVVDEDLPGPPPGP